ncbi:16S rRNA (guanine(527)-N(7))-methyltransferase RsmG [Pelagibacterium halotolerans]|uniref:Ribosomal RNA small subunit methyltransferase G n=1 Tax=Pelagibacterium halotolerans (strain DSM 22347 / JCM 15775 / CGMCC 1.7692 / B2) TaxID=1082931 RepID=G4R7Q3_PELHB|nr:16S rRNA (guanine(527)-N(7))-methyltransferase RsmG [Pelagibacterium halotolerans]AEQ53313.1 rRNA small subunit methyltransferase, glucose inhibited division protein GidB [Pelagibacterium halotolerans B2]QJR17072.1 16S rRNA (guanine(527)-N(7))-methyltransferase RsmG [Pelagibacterium halotolerans]SEA63219.1 16S rRNA (guanine527-N7)-methyltransferase [Pelagibacterium halotolerans]
MSGAAQRIADLERHNAAMFGNVEVTSTQLHSFLGHLLRWQKVQNLVSRETPGDLWSRHILDSLQILPLIGPISGPLRILDIGSGGGFPAIPMAIALRDIDFSMHLIESNTRKCAFLRATAREFDLPITVHTARIEAVPPATIGSIDLFTSRALAPLPLLLSYIHRFWSPESRAILHKGRENGEELKSADSDWVYDVLKHQSATDKDGVLLEISHLRPRT